MSSLDRLTPSEVAVLAAHLRSMAANAAMHMDHPAAIRLYDIAERLDADAEAEDKP